MSGNEPNVCLSCLRPFEKDSAFIACSCCSNNYHAGKCAGMTKTAMKALSSIERESWTCPTCTVNKTRSQQLSAASEPSLSAIMQEIKKIGQVLTAVHEKIAVMDSKINALTTKHEELAVCVAQNSKSLENANNRCTSLEASNLHQKNEILQLKLQINALEQYGRRNNIEIRGIPVSAGEDILNIVNAVAVRLQLPPLTNTDYDAIHRLPSKEGDLAPPVIVRFKDRRMRDTWLGQKID